METKTLPETRQEAKLIALYRKLSEPERQAVHRYFASLAQTPEPAPPQNRSVK